MSWRSAFPVVVVAAIALAPPVDAQTTVVPLDGVEDPDEDQPADPVAQASPPRALAVTGDLPEVPAQPPDGFAVMAFENRSGVRALDWLTAGAPLTLAEKLERQLPLAPTYDAWVIPVGPVIPATADTVAGFAATRGARYVWTGWVERPNWQLRLAISLWRVDAGAATSLGEVIAVGPFDDVHRMIGDAAVQLVGAAGLAVSDAAAEALRARTTHDLYAFTLVGRGVAHLRGTLGKIDLAGARNDLERAIFIEPDLALGQRLVGQLWLDAPKDPKNPKNASRAAGKFAYAVDLAPGYPPAVYAAATAARQSGKADIARDLYEQVVRKRPWDLEARLFLGEALWQTGQSESALRELERVIKRSPDDLRARRVIALVHSDRGDLEALVGALEGIADRAPDDVPVRMDLAAAYVALGRWDQAHDAYAAVAEVRPDDRTVLKLLGDVERRRGDPAAAAAWYGRMGKAAPGDPRPAFLIGLAWLDAGDLEKAHKALLHAQQAKEYLGHAFSALGAIQYRRGLYDEALWYLRRAAQRNSHSGRARVAHARVLLMKHAGKEALAEVVAARGLGAEGAELDYLTAIAQAELGELEAARLAARAALTASPGLGEARRALAAIDRGEVPAVEGAPSLDLPFGDIEDFEAAIDAALAAADAMSAVRKQLDEQYLTALAAMGEGPGKDLSKAARARPQSRVCPLAQVAQPTIAARKLEKVLYRRGNVLGETVRKVTQLDELGEAAGLTPAYRRRVVEVRRAWRRALVGVREVRSELVNQLGRELKVRRCEDPLLVAAAAHPELYGKPTIKVAAPTATVAAKRLPAPATLYIDNRECTAAVDLWIDGELIGTAPGGQRTAFEASVGQRTLCLLGPGDAGECGDRGTVRRAYLHDGWSAMLHCRGEGQRDVEAMPGLPAGDAGGGGGGDAGVGDGGDAGVVEGG